MNIKFLLFLAILVAAGYYAVEVKGINPFAKKIADDVPFRKFDGEVTTMKDLQGENGTLILSMSTWCPHCVEQLVNVYPLNEGFQQYKINVVLIVHGPDRDAIHEWAGQYQVPWNWKKVYWHDDLTDLLKIKKNATPYIILRDRNKKIVYSESGMHPMDRIMDITGEMLMTYEEFKKEMEKEAKKRKIPL